MSFRGKEGGREGGGAGKMVADVAAADAGLKRRWSLGGRRRNGSPRAMMTINEGHLFRPSHVTLSV